MRSEKQKATRKEWQKKNKERLNAIQRERYRSDERIRQRQHEYALKNREKHKEYDAKKYRKFSPEIKQKNRERAKLWYINNPEKVRERLIRTRETTNAQQVARKVKWKAAAFLLLGDKCYKCGYDDARALQVDHVNGDGAKERKEKTRARTSYLFYKDIALGLETMKKYQLLCCNCNWIKRYENNEVNQHHRVYADT